MFSGSFSPAGFTVVADNALDLVVGTQAASSGYVGANIQKMASTLHSDLGSVANSIRSSAASVAQVNNAGFAAVDRQLQQGLGTLEVLSGMSIAIQAAGFAGVAAKLQGLSGDIKALHRDLVGQGRQLIELQNLANAKLESLVHFAERTLLTQEQILQSLVSSRTVEAQQLIRQGWENLQHGFEDEAFSRFERSLEYDNTVYVAHAHLASLSSKRGDAQRAAEHYSKAVAFSSSAGNDVSAYALVQYARFLDEEGRVPAALEHVNRALAKSERPEWSFYRCELLTRAGDYDAALHSLERLIQAHPQFFTAAMSSPVLAQNGKALSELLVRIDSSRRAKLIEQIERVSREVEALGAATRAVDGNDEAAPFRSRLRAIFEASLTCQFDGLDVQVEATKGLQQEVERQLSRTCTARQSDADRLKIHRATIPSVHVDKMFLEFVLLCASIAMAVGCLASVFVAFVRPTVAVAIPFLAYLSYRLVVHFRYSAYRAWRDEYIALQSEFLDKVDKQRQAVRAAPGWEDSHVLSDFAAKLDAMMVTQTLLMPRNFEFLEKFESTLKKGISTLRDAVTARFQTPAKDVETSSKPAND